MEKWKFIKEHVPIPIIFLAIGYFAGLGTYKYLSSILNTDVVLKGSYIYKSDLDQKYVHIDKFRELHSDLEYYKNENSILKKQNDKIQSHISELSTSMCTRYTLEANAIIEEQRRVEKKIQDALSLHISFSMKDKDILLADKEKAKELRRYSEQLNQQLIQVREKMAKCIK